VRLPLSAMLILASASPQRRAILERLGIEFEVAVADVAELEHGEPGAVVVENALRKARAVSGDLVLGADTEVALDGEVFGKATDERRAESFLRRLSGCSHEVLTGIALIEGGEERTAVARTEVAFRDLDAATVAWYLDTGEWRDRAGAYAIQGKGAALVEHIRGDYLNVVGLPVATLLELKPSLLLRNG
jgi:septum formation protein